MSGGGDENAIAITAVAGRFPGAPNVETFWANLREGVESIHRFTDDELRAAGVSEAHLADPNYVKARPRLADVDQFDAAFFGIPPREAEVMDPQHRLFLEVAHEALERAGIAPGMFDGLIGVFGAAATSSYLLHNLNGNGRAAAAGAVLGTGNFADFLTTRVSYKLNLGGPAFTLQTACSGSLVAVHVAAQSLLNFECDAALAGGVVVNLPQDSGYIYHEEGVTSPDGRCRPFDAQAQGTIFGSGVGVVALRRLADAQREGDRVLAVLKGSAINNDGAVKAGFTAPAIAGQAEVISEALANAGVTADEISYVEAHGTATPLGDPIEVAALTKAFRETTNRRGFCALGSVKSNIGHLDAAGGVAGLIKTVLALHHRELPASLHFRTPNPKIDFANSPFTVNATRRAWPVPADSKPRRAGVSAFGVGGTNAHVILEEAPAVAARSASERPGRRHVLTLSARSETALAAATTALAERLEQWPDEALPAAVQTLREGRRALEHRRVVVAADRTDAVAALRERDAARVATGRVKPGVREVAFLFPGQGAQVVNMGRELAEAEPVFRAAFEHCMALFAPFLGESLVAVVHPPGEANAAAEARLRRTDLAQPALFAVEYALAQLWQSWGVKPAALLGHSLGEVTAACVAGVFSLEDAVRIVAARGRLMQALPEGAMLAVTLPPAELKPHLTPVLSLAIVNGPRACVVAGADPEIAALEDTLRERGVMARRLPTSHAFQSHLMEPVVAPLLAEMKQVELHPPKVPFLSNVTGRWITATEATDPAYWARQLRQTVYFADGLRELAKEPNRLFVEVGPGRILAGLARPNMTAGDTRSVWASLPDARERKSEAATVLGTLGRLWIAGAPVDWRAFRGAEPPARLELPTYPFEHQRFWIDPERAEERNPAQGPLERAPFEKWFYAPVWKQAVAARPLPIAGAWIVVGDADGVGAALAAKLTEAGATVVEHPAGVAWAETLRRAQSSEQPLRGIVATDFLAVRSEAAALEAFNQLISLAAAWMEAGAGQSVDLLLPTRAVHAVLGTDAVEPAGALAAGLAQVLPMELPMLNTRQVDFPVEADSQAIASHLLREAVRADDVRLAAWRADSRWVTHFEPLPVPTSATGLARDGGVYVITGGFGGIGLALAGMLAKSARVRLLLVSRRGGAGQAATIDKLQGQGAEVLPVAADIATARGWADVFDAAKARWGAVTGLIHAAGVPGKTIAARKTAPEAAAVFAAKVNGTAALAEVLRGETLEWVVLCSSLAVWSGSAGQSDYVAANAYLDAQAARWRKQGIRATSINWDLWRDVGMGVKEAQGNPFAISPAEGGAALQRAFAADRAQVIVSTGALPQRFAAVTVMAKSGDDPAASRPRYPRPALTTEFVPPAPGLEEQVAGQWAALLGLDRVGADDNFFELGGDSLTAMQAIAAIRGATGATVAVTTFYDQPTPRRLTPLVRSAQPLRDAP